MLLFYPQWFEYSLSSECSYHRSFADIPHSELPVLILYSFVNVWHFDFDPVVDNLYFSCIFLGRKTAIKMFCCQASHQGIYYSVLVGNAWGSLSGCCFGFTLYTNNGATYRTTEYYIICIICCYYFYLAYTGDLHYPKLIKLIKPAPEEKQYEKELNILLIEKSLSCLQTITSQNEMSQDIITTMAEKAKKKN